MSDYKRMYRKGGLYFFTVVTANRRPIFGENANVQILRGGIRDVMERRPFKIPAMVVLPDHLHCLWELPDGDDDYSNRWKMIKGYVSRRFAGTNKKIWQPRFWEHLIRDERDHEKHLDYIHFNPVKHGLVNNPGEWPWSSFNRYRQKGMYPDGWGKCEPESVNGMNCE